MMKYTGFSLSLTKEQIEKYYQNYCWEGLKDSPELMLEPINPHIINPINKNEIPLEIQFFIFVVHDF